MNKILVVGSSNTDMVFRTSKIPVGGETVMGSQFDVVQGGKGANQAVAAARAGGNVTFIAKLGTDSFANQALEGYKADNIDTSRILNTSEAPTGVAVILVDENTGQNSIVVVPGANAKLSRSDIQASQDVIKSAKIVLVQLEIPLEVVSLTLRIAKEYGVKTVLNPAPAHALSKELLSFVDIITPNETEAEILTGIKLDDLQAVKKAAYILLESVNTAVLITLGSKGVYYANKNGDNGLIPTTKVEAIDTTAAGDVFNGYFVKTIADGATFIEAIQTANKAAALSVTRKGAQTSIPYEHELSSSKVNESAF